MFATGDSSLYQALYEVGLSIDQSKPDLLIMRHAIELLGSRREETVIIGDRMDTDIVAGIESGIDTLLVLSGITKESDIERYAYKPHYALENVSGISGQGAW